LLANFESEELREAAAGVLSAWDLKADQISLVSVSENIVFRADTGCGSYALRLHRPGYHSLEELNSEIALHDLVRSAGLDTPLALQQKNGEYYAQIDMPGSDETRYVGLCHWIDGIVLEDLIEQSDSAEARIKAYRRLGRITATMHQHAACWSPPAGFKRHALDLDGFVGSRPFWGRFWEAGPATEEQRCELARARQSLRGFLASLDKSKEYFGVIHADLHPGNIMVAGDHVVVFDFDDAAFGWFLYDIATAVFDAWLYEDGFDETFEALVSGYSELRAFTDDMRRLIPKFLMARLLAYVGWRDARPEYGEPEFLPGLIDTTCARAREILF